MQRLTSTFLVFLSFLSLSTCGRNVDPDNSDRFFIENAQLSFETVNYESIGDFQKPIIEAGSDLVFVFKDDKKISLTNQGILSMKSESPVPDNVIIIQVPISTQEEYIINLFDLSENERSDIALYRGIYDGVYIENIYFKTTSEENDTWSVELTVDLSNQGSSYFTISGSGKYRKATIE